MQFSEPAFAFGFLPAGVATGKVAQTVRGCTAVKQAAAGSWVIVPDASNMVNGIDYIMIASPQLDSFAEPVCVIQNGTAIKALAADDSAAIDAGIAFACFLLPKDR